MSEAYVVTKGGRFMQSVSRTGGAFVPHVEQGYRFKWSPYSSAAHRFSERNEAEEMALKSHGQAVLASEALNND